MITLYQLHWSHFVEKVCWALDYKGIAWTAVDVDPFTKREMQHLPCRATLETGQRAYIVPAIHDASTGAVVSESSVIIDYLERSYPTTPLLFPASEQARSEVERWMRWLDSTLGLAARRLAYTQIVLEHPGLIGELFMPHLAKGGAGRLKTRLAGIVISGVLAQRFRFLHNRADRTFEQLEHCLLTVAERLNGREYLVGERFSAADLTLAALLRPAVLVPFFRDHPRLQRLFEWRQSQLTAHRRPLQLGYEAALHEVRRRRGSALGAVRWLSAEHRDYDLATGVPDLPKARNDQQRIGRWPLIAGPLAYLRLKRTCGLERIDYPS